MATLTQLVAEKAGITESQAQMAVKTVADFLKEKLPAPIAGQIDALLTADVSSVAGAAESVMKGLGGFMGSKKEG